MKTFAEKLDKLAKKHSPGPVLFAGADGLDICAVVRVDGDYLACDRPTAARLLGKSGEVFSLCAECRDRYSGMLLGWGYVIEDKT